MKIYPKMQNSSQQANREHPDYQKNLQSAETFIKNTKKSLLNGMSVKICDSEHLSKCLMSIAWTPPKESPMGRCCTPINLNQNSSSVMTQIENVFNTYMKTAKSCEDSMQRKIPGIDV